MFPKLFTIGSFSVPTYGVLVALGFFRNRTLKDQLAVTHSALSH